MRNHRGLCAVLALLMLAGLFCSCGRKEPAPEEEEKPQAVFRGTDIEAHGSPVSDVTPYCDAEAGTLALVVSERDGADGPLRYARAVFRPTEDGTEAVEESTEPLPLPDDEIIMSGILTENGYTFLIMAGNYPDQTYYVRTRERETETVSEELSGMAGEGVFQPRFLSVGGDGAIWLMPLGGLNDIVVLSPDLSPRLTFQWNDLVLSAAADEKDGAWIISSFYGLCHADRYGNPDDPVPHETGTLYSVFLLPAEDGESVLPACVTDKGIEVWENGEWRLFMDYVESGLTSYSDLLAVLPDRKTALFVKHDEEGEILRLYRLREDADPAGEVRTVDIAVYLPAETMQTKPFRDAVTEFNASHADVKVKVTNYAETYPSGVYQAKDALLRDIVTGVYRPDMIYGQRPEIFQTVIDHGLCLDLTPYIENDPKVNRETLFGAVLQTMEYDGMIWGLPQSVRCHALAGLNSVLGAYAGRESWTVEEELAFLASLPPEVEPLEGSVQNKAVGCLMYYTDLRQFIDLENGTCSFDGPEAVEMFRWLSTLPATAIEYRKRYSSPSISFDDKTTLDRLYAEGKIALKSCDFYDAESYAAIPLSFLSDDPSDVTLIGYPTVGDGRYGGIVTSVGHSLMILNTAEHPDDAWAFLCAFLLNGSSVSGENGASPLRTVFDRVQTNSGVRVKYEDGTGFIGPSDPNPSRKGIRVSYGRTQSEAVKDILDRAGAPILSGIGEDVSAIISEELSAMSAGASSPED